MADTGAERLVLVGTVWPSLSTTWYEHPGTTDEVLAKRIAKAEKDNGGARPEEILEVVVVRRIRIRTEVTVVDDSAADGGAA